MKTVVTFFKNNNARIGATLSAILVYIASRQLVSEPFIDMANVLMGVWVAGSWTQGAKKKFKA